VHIKHKTLKANQGQNVCDCQCHAAMNPWSSMSLAADVVTKTQP